MTMGWHSFFALGLLSLSALASAFPNEIVARETSSNASTSISAPPTRSHPTSLPHSSYNGTATVTGAITASSIGTGIPSGSVVHSATTYPSDGKLHNVEPAPYDPAGGVGTNGSIPVYNAKSDFDYESLVCSSFHILPISLQKSLTAKYRPLYYIKSGLSWICSKTD